MASLAPKGTYIKIQINVWRDKKTGVLHITSDDPDLPPNSVHITVTKGSKSDANLRALLESMVTAPATT